MGISAETLKEFFRHHAAGVSLVTTFSSEGVPYGFTASSLASLSADPALATVNLAKGTSTASILKVGSPVAIHALSAQNADLAAELAGPRENRFKSKLWDLSGLAPVNQAASAVLSGVVSEIHEVAGSLIIVIAADEADLREFPQTPLVYFNRKYL